MVDSVDFNIPAALCDHFGDLDLGDTSVAYPMRYFKTPEAGPKVSWVRLVFLPADTLTLFASPQSSNQHEGLFQADIFYALETATQAGGGEAAPIRIASKIIEHFAERTTLNREGYRITIPRKPSLRPSVKEAPWSMTSVRISYLCFAR